MKLYVTPLAIAICLPLVGCGGSSEVGGGNTTPSVPDEPTVPEEPGEPVDPSCSAPKDLIFKLASDDGAHKVGFGPENAIDGSIDSDSRWSSEGIGKQITFSLSSPSILNSLSLYWLNNTERSTYYDVAISTDNVTWQDVVTGGNSDNATGTPEFIDISDTLHQDIQYLRVTGNGNSESNWNSLIEITALGCNDEEVTEPVEDLNPSLPPSANFDLQDWYLSIPTDTDNSGTADSIKESELNNGYENNEYFYTGADGGMVFKSPIYGYKTSANTTYVRTELREMLRRGNTSIKTQGVNKNNWVFSSAPSSAQTAAGGVNGELFATLAVNHVTTTGDAYQIGRVIIGQIHANDDEPIRLYYRKLPNNQNGAIYFAHESRNASSDDWVEMIGSRSDNASNPADGIALDEKFSYRIKVVANMLYVTIYREGKDQVTASYNMSSSSYDDADQYMYFKAGVYNQNKSGDDDDYVQATFYVLNNSHDGYNP
ncbi:hypothetical protein AHAT_01470 [Agarivorans sp. Toyoura001]|uniref:polysaccharide lyase family 7 protein n=1 Tax=Agarivorans sp. Toyoura001 TaxID=2283141 RepID=UPI0010E61192|nr:polysaccharide lyase family 7 protein [Agarivorans sp. Toyoura001]GDY24257.1 hypothetical protein AHAT_01470 [Agarivorans sp. Toyoura001]